MEHVQKEISLESAKDRLICSGISHISGTSYAYDRVLSGNDSIVAKFTELIPLIKLKDGKYLLRYKNLIDKYYWLTDVFTKKCRIYLVCNRNGEKIYVNKDNNNPFLDATISESTINKDFQISGLNVGTSVCFCNEYDSLIRNYKSYEKAKEFYQWVCNTVISGGSYNNIGVNSGIPYLNIDLYLCQEYDDEGIFTPYATEWEAGKKVCVGDVIYYNSGTTTMDTLPYVLKSGGTFSIGTYKGDNLGNIEIPKSVYDEISKKTGSTTTSITHSFVYSATTSDGISKYYMYTPHYEGNFDANKKLYTFDDGKHYGTSYERSDTATTFNYVSQSHLGDVRTIKNDCDDEGNVLPFNLKIEKNSGGTITNITPIFQHKCSINNTSILTDGRNVGNAMISITFYDKDNSTSLPKKIYTLSNNENEDIIIDNNIRGSNAVMFRYRIMSELYTVSGGTEAKWKVNEDTGIYFEEKYNMSIEKEKYTIEGVTSEYEYISLCGQIGDYLTNMNEDLKKYKLYPTFSNINSHTSDAVYEKVPIFKEESLIGTMNQRKDIDVQLERGKSDAFERHNAITEINSMEDLLHYRNDYWKVASES